MQNDLARIGLGSIQRVKDWLMSAHADSLIEYTASTRVEPIVLIDESMLYWEGMSELQQSLLMIFCGYYMQAVSISTRVGNINVAHRLDKLNPSRSLMENVFTDSQYMLAAESYKNGLPFPGKKLGMESAGDDVMNAALRPDQVNNLTELDERNTNSSFTKDAGMVMRELSNQSVGKILDLEIQDGNHKATIPVNVRLIASTMSTPGIIHILSIGNKDITVKERYHAWRADRLEFFRDLIFCNDLIDAHRENLIRDKDGVYSTILARRNKNKLSTILSGRPSVATASNIAVISTTTRDMLELEINQSMSSFKTRQKLFKETSLMLLVVVDKQHDRITIYHRGIPLPTELSLRDIKASNKGGPDVSEILKAYQMGAAPTL